MVYREHGGEIALTLCAEHGAAVTAALGDRKARWGVLVTSHDPPRVIVEEPRQRRLGRYRGLVVVQEPGAWPTVELRQSAWSGRSVAYYPTAPIIAGLDRDEGVTYELLEVSPEEVIGDYGVPWPKSLIIQRRHAGYTDRQVYITSSIDLA